MAETTHISWADATLNFWIGCTKIGPECDGCYAESRDKRFASGEHWGPRAPRQRTTQATWDKALAWNRKALAADARPFVFANSLSDMFDKEVDPRWRVDAFRRMRETPALVWLLLTKRPQNIVKMCEWAGGLPPNAAIGTTAGTRDTLATNAPALMRAKAAVRPLFAFLSAGPLLEEIDVTPYVGQDGLDWVIGEGESEQPGHEPRPPLIQWVRKLRDDAKAAGVPFQWKQWGAYTPDDPAAVRTSMRRVGTKKSGRLLDGREWLERPEVPALRIAA